MATDGVEVDGPPAGSDATKEQTQAQAQTISADEIALYDRQIRLWGVQAQEKIRTANILLLRAKALANEVAKNLVLAGIGSLTVVDHEAVTEDDLGSQFFVSEEHVGQNRAEAAVPQIQQLNPLVKVTASSADLGTLTTDFYAPFDIVIATDLDFLSLSTVNAITRLCNKPFYAAGSHGMYGFIFADLIMHQFSIERVKSNVATVLGPESNMRSILSATEKRENGKTIELVTKQELYSPLLLANSSPLPSEITTSARRLRNVTPLLPCLRALWDFEKMSSGAKPSHSRQDLATFTRLATEKLRELSLPPDMLKSEFLRSFLQNLGSEFAPVTAFLGGMLAQDAINVLGQRQQPIQNLVLFDGEESKGPMYSLHPVFDASLAAMDGNSLGMPMGDMGTADASLAMAAAGNGMMPMSLDGAIQMNGLDMATGMNGLNGMDPMGSFGGMGMDGSAGLMGMTGMNGMDVNPMIDMGAMSGMVGMGMDATGMDATGMLPTPQQTAVPDAGVYPPPEQSTSSSVADGAAAAAGADLPDAQPEAIPRVIEASKAGKDASGAPAEDATQEAGEGSAIAAQDAEAKASAEQEPKPQPQAEQETSGADAATK